MRRLVPDLVGEVTDVRFEHSPGRGHPGYTADHTAFDVLIRCTTPHGRHAFVAIEMKYSEAPAGIASPERPRYDTLSRSAGVFRDADAPALRHAPIEQFWREQLLSHSDARAGPLSRRPVARDRAGVERRVPGGHRTVSHRTGLGRSRRDALPAVTLEGSHDRCRCRWGRHDRGSGDRALPRLRAGPSCPGSDVPATIPRARRVRRRRGVISTLRTGCHFHLAPTADTHPEPGFPILPVRSGFDPQPPFAPICSNAGSCPIAVMGSAPAIGSALILAECASRLAIVTCRGGSAEQRAG